MPELPEVETVVRELRAAGLVGRRLLGGVVRHAPLVAPLAPGPFLARLQGRRVRSLARRGKYIVLRLTGGRTLLVHLRMTGQLRLGAPEPSRDPHEHLWLRLDDGRELRYRDTRKFGRWLLTTTPAMVLGRLGPEPLARDLTGRAFAARLAARPRRLKALLLDASFVAGIGNIYADESLWLARLHPRRLAATLSAAEAGRLLSAIRTVLRRAIRNAGTSLGSGRANFKRPNGGHGRHREALRVYGRAGAPCRRCGTPIQRLVVVQRGTHVCPRCQAEPPASARRPGRPAGRATGVRPAAAGPRGGRPAAPRRGTPSARP